jgi:hypothetical protein
MIRRLLAGALALALFAAPPPARAVDSFAVNGSSIPGIAPPQGFLPPVAAYFPNGLFSASSPGWVQGSFSATLSGFAPGGAYATPLGVSTISANRALPAGQVVVVYNVGTAPAYITLGTSSGVAATTSGDVVPAGGWMAFTVGSNSYLAAITASGSTTLNISGGAGLPTGGGGGGGGSGGTVAQGSPNTAANAWPVALAQGGVAVGASNGLYVLPASGATFNLGTLNGAALAANQPALNGDGGALTHVTNWPSTQPVSWSGQNVGVSNNAVGAASLATSQASIGATAASIVAARTGAVGIGRIAVTLYNNGSATVYVGASGVTTSTGIPLAPGAALTLNTTAAVYGIAASGTQTIGVLETF